MPWSSGYRRRRYGRRRVSSYGRRRRGVYRSRMSFKKRRFTRGKFNSYMKTKNRLNTIATPGNRIHFVIKSGTFQNFSSAGTPLNTAAFEFSPVMANWMSGDQLTALVQFDYIYLKAVKAIVTIGSTDAGPNQDLDVRTIPIYNYVGSTTAANAPNGVPYGPLIAADIINAQSSSVMRNHTPKSTRGSIVFERRFQYRTARNLQWGGFRGNGVDEPLQSAYFYDIKPIPGSNPRAFWPQRNQIPVESKWDGDLPAASYFPYISSWYQIPCSPMLITLRSVAGFVASFSVTFAFEFVGLNWNAGSESIVGLAAKQHTPKPLPVIRYTIDPDGKCTNDIVPHTLTRVPQSTPFEVKRGGFEPVHEEADGQFDDGWTSQEDAAMSPPKRSRSVAASVPLIQGPPAPKSSHPSPQIVNNKK